MNRADGRRVAIVTGASGGIGAGLVNGFRGAGFAVVATSRSIRPGGDGDVLAVAGDIAAADTARRVMTAATDRFGRIDTLVNNAGVFIGKPFTEYTQDDLTATVAVNLAGFFHMTQLVLARMVEQGGGHVVSITTSLVDHADGTRPSTLASLTKGGIAAATRSLALEYAPHGVRVNAVAPGVIATPQHDRASYEGMAARHPLGRVGEVADVVEAVLYLERAAFVTGETLHVDGGRVAGN